MLSSASKKAQTEKSKKSGSVGHQSGGHNKVGHKAGSDRRSIKVTEEKQAKGQPSLKGMGFRRVGG